MGLSGPCQLKLMNRGSVRFPHLCDPRVNILKGYPLENLFQEKPSHRGLEEKLGTTAFATPIPQLEILMAKQLPNHNPF